jgi:hypothetical protein
LVEVVVVVVVVVDAVEPERKSQMVVQVGMLLVVAVAVEEVAGDMTRAIEVDDMDQDFLAAKVLSEVE